MQITDEMVDAAWIGWIKSLGKNPHDIPSAMRAALEAALGKDADTAPLSQVIGEIASELKCEPDNEAILEAISDLRKDYLRRHNDAVGRGMEVIRLRDTVSAQSAEIARLREALEWYADETHVMQVDVARAALEPKG